MSIDLISEMTEMLKLSRKYFKVAIINMIQEVRLNTFETNKKIKRLKIKENIKKNKIKNF